MSKLFIYDTETTGLYPTKNFIHQLAYIIVINDEVITKDKLYIKPPPLAEYDPKALEVSGVTHDQIDSYPDYKSVHKQLVLELSKHVNKFNKNDKFHLVGYNNIRFDNEFLRVLWSVCDDKYFGSMFWADSIDTMSLASSYLHKIRPTLPNFKLATVAEALGFTIEDEKLHDSFYDLELTYNIFKKIYCGL